MSTVEGQQVVNVIHVAAHNDVADWLDWDPDPSPAAIADELDSHLSSLYRAMLPTQSTLNRIDVVDEKDPRNPDRPRSGASKTINGAGTRTTGAQDIPQEMCAVATLKTAQIGRSFTGKLFLPPVLTPTSLQSHLLKTTDSYYTAAQAFLNALVPEFGGGSAWSSAWTDTWHASVVVYSKKRRSQNLSPFVSDVTSYKLGTHARWLRSRSAG